MMTRFLSVLLWTAVFALLLVGLDQLLVRVPATHPAHVAVATFYRDLRGRVFDLTKGAKPVPATPAASAKAKESPRAADSIEAVIGRRPEPGPAVKPPVKEQTLRYVYADDKGEIHFAETLAEVPEEYRIKAKALRE
jgi:hypothetical protein